MGTMRQSESIFPSWGHTPTVTSLAIARIFGGFPQSFFETYHKYLPKTEPVSQYDLRGELYQLYHFLNHTLLFGVSRLMICPYCKLSLFIGRIFRERV